MLLKRDLETGSASMINFCFKSFLFIKIEVTCQPRPRILIACNLRFAPPPIKNPGYANVPCQCFFLNFNQS